MMDNIEKRSNNIPWFIILPLICLFIIFTLFYSGIAAYTRKKTEERKAAAEMKKVLTEFVDASKDKDNMPARIAEIDTAPKAKGEYGEIERFTKEFLNEVASQRNSYLAALDSIGWNNLLSAERLKEDPTFEKTKLIIKNGKEVVEKYKAKTFSLLDNAHKNIDKLNMSEKKKREFTVGFKKGLVASSSKSRAIWEIETQIVDECANLVEFLDSKKGSWIIKDGKILFQNDSDLENFNSYIRNIQGMVAKQKALQQQNINAAKEKINKL